MQCRYGHESPDNAKFCSVCGAPLAVTAQTEINMPQKPIKNDPSIPALKIGKKGRIVVGVIVALFLIGKCGGDPEPTAAIASPSAVPSSSYSSGNYKDQISNSDEFERLQKASCKTIKAVIDSNNVQVKKYLSRIKAHPKVLKDGYSASDYMEQNKWTRVTSYANDLANRAEAIAIKYVKPTIVGKLSENGSYKLTLDTAALCAEVNSWPKASTLVESLSTARTLETKLQTMSATASTRPWYPKGYSQYDSTTAVKWLKGSQFKCDYYDSTCWGLGVISSEGCPSGLYVAINIEDSSGSVVDWSNDTVPSLAPGKSAKLVFNTFGSASTASISEVKCY